MPEYDPTAAAALDEPVQQPAFFAFADIDGLPQRATNAGYDIAFTGTGDDDLDGFTFTGLEPGMVEVGEVKYGENGSETLTVTVSGDVELDADLVEALQDESKWRSRPFRLWKMERAPDGDQIGLITPYYSGFMSTLSYDPRPEGTTIKIDIETYLASSAEASNRSYSGLASYDPGDTSALATIAAANGIKTGPGGTISVTSGGGDAGGSRLQYDVNLL